MKRSTSIVPSTSEGKRHSRRNSPPEDSVFHEDDYINAPYNVSIVLTSWFPPGIRVSWNFNPSRDSFNATTTSFHDTHGAGIDDKTGNSQDKDGITTVSEGPVSFQEYNTRSFVATSESLSSTSHPHSHKSLLKMFQIKYNPIGSRSVTFVLVS